VSGGSLSPRTVRALDRLNAAPGRVLVLTGAGISAESGIPTFRGKDGFWTIGSTNYDPEELATRQAFQRMPEELWAWYLHRRARCHAAEPNAAHRALVSLEQGLGDRFLLITQNVDGLHLRAGNSLERTFQIHGNIDFVRCSEDRCPEAERPTLLPADFALGWAKGRAVSEAERPLLRCRACGAWLRPHVLWFDESYDEENYRYLSSLRAASDGAGLIVIGTSGATTLPHRIAELIFRRAAPMIAVNAEPSPFTELADALPDGVHVQATAGGAVPEIVDHLLRAAR
jgi:NAD-dependent deacetylase